MALGRPELLAADPVARARDAPELLDVDVDQLPPARSLIADDRLQPESAALAHPHPR
jgi:hypothetical protein